jgi:ATP-dependent Clp protease adaptor protein ClpS
MSKKSNHQDQSGILVKERTKQPRRYKVFLVNDNFTTMEFVVEILQKVFRMTQPQATRVMLSVHTEGVGLAGIYTREVAETRLEQVHQLAYTAGHPLQATMEAE